MTRVNGRWPGQLRRYVAIYFPTENRARLGVTLRFLRIICRARWLLCRRQKQTAVIHFLCSTGRAVVGRLKIC